MTTNNFRTIALALREHISDTYALLAAADSVEAVVGTLDGTTTETVMEDQRLDNAGLANMEVMGHIFDGRLINAIKVHRALTGAGLRESKESCERLRDLALVQTALNVIRERDNKIAELSADLRAARLWVDHTERDEPPF
jgi:ribosomal protein L7/L12